jgi:hypothetical protein
MKLAKLSLVLLMVLTVGSVFSFANSAVIDFGVIAPTAGSISYAGGNTPLVGSGIQVDNVTGIGTPLCNGCAFNILGGSLDFVTGNFTSFTSNSWNFAGGGSISLSGCVDVDNNGSCGGGDISGTLLSGMFNFASVIAVGDSFKIAASSFMDVKNPDLAALFGLAPNCCVGNFNISFMASGQPPSGFASTQVLSGDITNTAIPEPASLVLLGSGFIGLGSFARRKLLGR